jgi:mRNA-degrading endonuclease RelE of RelBE toxin-antitoxin system
MQVKVTPKALKQYNRLPKFEQVKVKKKIQVLEQNSQEGKKLSGEYTKLRSLKAWPYRIIYYIDSAQKKIFIVTIAHRQGVYK